MVFLVFAVAIVIQTGDQWLLWCTDGEKDFVATKRLLYWWVIDPMHNKLLNINCKHLRECCIYFQNQENYESISSLMVSVYCARNIPVSASQGLIKHKYLCHGLQATLNRIAPRCQLSTMLPCVHIALEITYIYAYIYICVYICMCRLILGLRPANKRWCYFVTTSLIGWMQA